MNVPIPGMTSNNDTTVGDDPSSISNSRRCSTSAGTSTIRRCLCHFVDPETSNNNNDVTFNTSSTNTGIDDELLFSSTSVGDSTLRCSVCVQRILKPYLKRHERAIEDHQHAKMECSTKLRQLNDPTSRLAELQANSQQLRDQLTIIRKKCADMAVRVASQAVENDTHRETIQMDASIEQQRINLQRLEGNLLEGSMMHAIHIATGQVRVLRFQWARKVLAMHRLDIDPDDIKLTTVQKRRQESQPSQQLQRRARGIAKIAGLPLPNAGPELYGVLPPKELQSALRLVAMVTNTVARCLGIVLPHPILLTLNHSGSSGDIADTVSEEQLEQRRRQMGGNDPASANDKGRIGRSRQDKDSSSTHQQHSNNYHAHVQPGSGTSGVITRSSNHLSSSTSSLMSFMDGSYWTTKAKKALAKATGQQTTEKTAANIFISPSTDATIVAQRLEHATAAILADDTTVSANSSKFALSADSMHQDEFAIALQLLQNNVIVLCIRAGVPVSKLWPAEAMLLNLYELDQFCQQQVAVTY